MMRDEMVRPLLSRGMLSLALALSGCGGGGGAPATAATTASQDAAFPVRASAGIDTGLVKVAHTATLGPPVSTSIDWGDGSDTPVLLDCTRADSVVLCDYWNAHTYARPGTYTITVSYDLLFHQSTTATVTPIGDFVIVSVGDSVASGEGNPVVPARVEDILSHTAYWDSPNDHGDPDYHCHISSRAGPAAAARVIQSTNPASSVTLLHLACSGDDIGGAARQLARAAALLPARNIDALLISAGANDVDGGFGKVVAACLGPLPPKLPDPSVDCSTDDAFRLRLATDISGLDYGQIARAIADNGLTVADVYITEYFDPTHDAEGKFPAPLVDVCTGGLMKTAEWSFLYDNMVVPLNQKVMSTSAPPPDGYGWHYVGGLASDFLHHGYCADPTPGDPTGLSWVVKAPESFTIQEDFSGTSHPNGNGQARYQSRIVDAINLWTPPVTTATATAGGLPYLFGTWTSQDVTVTLSATSKLATAGTGDTYFAVDEPDCSGASIGSCSLYSGPFSIGASGTHTISFFTANASGKFERVKTAEVRIDKDPPVMTCASAPPFLWPPNGKMVPVSLTVTAVDAVSGPAPFFLESVTTSEGDAASDIQEFDIGLPDTDGWLLASRLGAGPGRIYAFTYESADALGNVGSCTVEVAVPHDRRQSTL